MASIKLKGDTSGEITIQAPAVAGTTTLNLPATSSTLATQNALGVRNLIINGDMKIDQRNAGASVDTTSTGNSTYSVDRWAYIVSVVSKFTLQQSSDAPTGLNTSLLITSSSAYSSLNTDYLNIRHMIEGVNFAHLGWGTADAKTVTLSFWVKSSLTGSFSGSLQNSAFSRSYPFTYSISSANTWEKKTITIAGDTTGTWLTTNGIGCRLNFNVGSGSDYLGTADSWSSSNLRGVTGTTALTATNGATLYITGVQLEVGDTATPFEHRPYDMELARCQRYAYKIGGDINTDYVDSAGGYYDANYISFGKVQFPVPMRTGPSATFNQGNAIAVVSANTTYTGWSWNVTISGVPSTRGCFINGNKASHGVTVNAGTMIRLTDTSDYIIFSAEL